MWCDYKTFQVLFYAQIPVVSIPVWCDYKGIASGNRSIAHKFQFQCGAIIRLTEINDHIRNDYVSIPVWCDYKEKYPHLFKKLNWVSIPVWCDYKIRIMAGNLPAIWFQFQCGAIISTVCFRFPHFFMWFQFQCGAIIRIHKTQKAFYLAAFQFQCGAIISTDSYGIKGFTKGFQFQCGGIISLHIRNLPVKNPRFNSSVVRL